jgi:hypothetical protein
MGQFISLNVDFSMSDSSPDRAFVRHSVGPDELMRFGLNIPVTVSTPTVSGGPPVSAEKKSLAVMAHFDTGASTTSIDIKIAEFLNLEPLGVLPGFTASGVSEMLSYLVDISFPSAPLAPFPNLNVCSCKLPFALTPTGPDYMTPVNFGVLIGRDIMSEWNIVWNGPTSSVFISD